MKKLLLISLVLAFQTTAFGEKGSFDSIARLRNAQDLQSNRCAQCEVIEVKAVEFSNGNTDVQIKSSVAGRSVVILTSETIGANDFMELLIEARAMKNNGAREVSVEVAGNSSQIKVLDSKGAQIELNLSLLLSTAGVDALMDSRNIRDISELALRTKLDLQRERRNGKTLSEKDYVVDSMAHESLAKDLASNMGTSMLPANALQDHSADALEGKGVILVSTQANPVNENLLKTMTRVGALNARGAQVHMVFGYLPYARSDKADRPGVTTSGALAADLLQSSGIRGISYVRAHAPQASGFYGSMPLRETLSFKSIKQSLINEKIDLVISPDAGAQKEATKFADILGVPVAVINKQRVGDKIEIRGISLPEGMESLKGKRVMIIDDETASGSTLADAAAELANRGAEVYASVTHLAGTAKAAIQNPAVKKIFVTDSIPLEVSSEKVVVVSIANELASDISQLLWAPKRCATALAGH